MRARRVGWRLCPTPAARHADHGDVYRRAALAAFIGGQAVALLLGQSGWPVIFIIGGVFPVLLVVVLALWLPESPRILAARQALSPRNAALLERLDIASVESGAVETTPGNPVWMVFGRGYALQTGLLWIIYFCSLLNLFLFVYGLPTVLNLIGMSPAQAVFASSLRELGDIRGLVSWPGDRSTRSQAGTSAALRGRCYIHRGDRACHAPVCHSLHYHFLGWDDDHRQPDRPQRGVREAPPGAHAYKRPRLGARHRPLGAIVAPILGGYLLAIGVAPTRIFLVACLFAQIAAAAALLVFRRSRGDSLGAEQVAP